METKPARYIWWIMGPTYATQEEAIASARKYLEDNTPTHTRELFVARVVATVKGIVTLEAELE